jgi:hypothetical protein
MTVPLIVKREFSTRQGRRRASLAHSRLREALRLFLRRACASIQGRTHARPQERPRYYSLRSLSDKAVDEPPIDAAQCKKDDSTLLAVHSGI